MSRHPCWRPGGLPCQSFHPGHNLHWIHARRIGETPWGWRDGVLVENRGGRLVVEYLAEDHHVVLWNHRPVDGTEIGSPVRVHERYYALSGRFGWLNVHVTGGLGPVPEPPAPELYGPEIVVPVVDLATGRALPLDGPDADRRV